jgi:DNA polymerase III epsilon subunit-like protein
MSLALDHDFVAIDFETTGTVGQFPDEPWQIGMVRIRSAEILQNEAFERYLRVGDRPFNPHAPGRHAKIRTKLASAPRLIDLWPQLRPWWTGTPLVAHNVGTERKFVHRTAPLHRMGPWIDTLKLVRIAYPTLQSHALADVLADLELMPQVQSLCPGRSAHDALFDAVGCAVLFLFLLRMDSWSAVTLESLVVLAGKAK